MDTFPRQECVNMNSGHLRIYLVCIRIVLYFFQSNECRTSDIIALQNVDTFFGRFNGINNDIVQSATAC